MKRVVWIAGLMCFIFQHLNATPHFAKDSVIVYPAPSGEELSQIYRVSASGKNVPVFIAKVEHPDKRYRQKMYDSERFKGGYYETTSFASIDLRGRVMINVEVADKIKIIKILPSSARIKAQIKGNKVSFEVNRAQQLTIEINGETVKSLHIFINPFEKNKPDPKDPNVIYYGPGIHNISHIQVGSNKTLYVAGGAILRATVDFSEKYSLEKETTVRLYSPSIVLNGNNIKLMGRGIIDGSLCPTHARRMISTQGKSILLQGVIIRDAPTWAMPVQCSENVIIDNLKLIGYRSNSDGINIVSSKKVTVQNCFVRTNDDLVVVKTNEGQGTAEHILVRNCVLWNHLAHALSIGAEVRENVKNVVFKDCDIIHDTGREWVLRIFQSDAATIQDVSFENIRIEEAVRFISVWIGKSIWSRDEFRGHIKNVDFKNINAKGNNLTIDLTGFDSDHQVENVILNNIKINGRAMTTKAVKRNDFVDNVVVKP
ncbi:glycosyl hydrolase family 28 protein [Arcticibacter tournemirensis]|uniref:Endo-polygalacturonase n=2 Tax=Pseudomonadati TaxID=3379134 RepID=A0A4Q0M887_9SPHI|nr:glycosyl hydrolase family 28 protein [Arcticibacter tournemirensis]RXF69350.1 endo-polygalacturonase [Arcticibacter tournemirensis]